MELTAIYERDGDWVLGYVVEIPGVNTQGRTLDECRENLRDALGEYVAARRAEADAEDTSLRIAIEHPNLGQVA